MLLKPEKAAIVSMTCALLHNFLRRSPNGSFDYEEDGHFQPGSWRLDSSKSSLTSLAKAPRKPSQEAKEIRQEFAEYFITNGAVE
jgi:hypothetical protein